MIERPRWTSYTSGLWPCGVATYQQHLAAALSAQVEVHTIRLPTARVLGDDLPAILSRRRFYQRLARQSVGAQLALIDYTSTFWNGSRLGENFFPAFARALPVPAVVIVHEDVGRTDPADTSGPYLVRALKRLVHLGLAAWDTRSRRYETFVSQHLFDFAAHVVVHAQSLASITPGQTRVLPPPIYPLPQPTMSPEELDARWGLAGRRVAVLFGFPQPSKGFDRAVAALPHLPEDWILLQVGGSDRSRSEAENLSRLAEQLGVGRRFVRTGYLTEGELAAVLQRGTVAVAPFRSVHHSSSLGHLITAGLPIIAQPLPVLDPLTQTGADLTFVDCDNPVSLANTIQELGNHSPSRSRVPNSGSGFDMVAQQLLGLAAELRLGGRS